MNMAATCGRNDVPRMGHRAASRQRPSIGTAGSRGPTRRNHCDECGSSARGAGVSAVSTGRAVSGKPRPPPDDRISRRLTAGCRKVFRQASCQRRAPLLGRLAEGKMRMARHPVPSRSSLRLIPETALRLLERRLERGSDRRIGQRSCNASCAPTDLRDQRKPCRSTEGRNVPDPVSSRISGRAVESGARRRGFLRKPLPKRTF